MKKKIILLLNQEFFFQNKLLIITQNILLDEKTVFVIFRWKHSSLFLKKIFSIIHNYNESDFNDLLLDNFSENYSLLKISNF